MREDVTFGSGGVRCAAWLYRPAGERPPVIVMAHGLGGVRGMRLDAFAERFTAAGYACLVFDYRHFGDSEGEPRRLIDVGRQLDDYAAALAFARTLDGVDTERVVLWGTSFSGGHVMRAAARDGRVAAVVAQCPFTDGPASTRAMPLRAALGVSALAARDLVGAALGRDPVRVTLAAEPGHVGLMASPDALSGYSALVPEGAELGNAVAARVGARIPTYSPGRSAGGVTCPLFVAVCDPDTVAPSAATLRHLSSAPRATVRRYPHGHFDIYVGSAFEEVVADELAFLAETVPVPAADA